jgi:hypothetical protein
VPIETLAQHANIVVLASVASLLPNQPAGPSIQLNVERWIKGQTGMSNIIASVPVIAQAPPDVSTGVFEVVQRGIWFATSSASGTAYQLLPMVSGNIVPNQDHFLPVSTSLPAPDPTSTINQQLLSYLVGWYQGLPQPDSDDDGKLLASFDPGRVGLLVSPQDLLTAAAPLTGSVVLSQHVIGLAISIGLGSDYALSSVAQELGSISLNPKFPAITGSITYRSPYDAPGIAILASLASLHSAIAGLDNSIAVALSPVSSRTVVPIMATLLDSSDPTVQRRAASYFARYSIFADQQGNFPSTGPVGPFSTALTLQYTPRADSGLATADYVSFWKGWWTSNQAALGFSSQ